MKAFITGGTGFIGRRILLKLLQRGYDVTALVRSQEDATAMRALGVRPVMGDIRKKESLREGMQGSDVVFHLAAWYNYNVPSKELVGAINVEGARNVLTLAAELGIPKIVHTSTLTVFGDTHGRLVDENYIPLPKDLATTYYRTKWEAHFGVALPLIEQGAPLIIVMSGAAFGPGDHSVIGKGMRLFYQGRLPAIPGPDTQITFAHVDDIAEGHILAAEKGVVGETYIVAGPAYKLESLVKRWAEVTGKQPPKFSIPGSILKPFAPVMEVIGKVLPVPELMSADAIRTLGVTIIGKADKARDELGWETRPIDEGLKETFDWIARTSRQPTKPQPQKASAAIIASAVGFFALWLLTRHKRE